MCEFVSGPEPDFEDECGRAKLVYKDLKLNFLSTPVLTMLTRQVAHGEFVARQEGVCSWRAASRDHLWKFFLNRQAGASDQAEGAEEDAKL